ncbi:mucin-5AC, partial [Biomphalaria pfeifferi]
NYTWTFPVFTTLTTTTGTTKLTTPTTEAVTAYTTTPVTTASSTSAATGTTKDAITANSTAAPLSGGYIDTSVPLPSLQNDTTTSASLLSFSNRSYTAFNTTTTAFPTYNTTWFSFNTSSNPNATLATTKSAVLTPSGSNTFTSANNASLAQNTTLASPNVTTASTSTTSSLTKLNATSAATSSSFDTSLFTTTINSTKQNLTFTTPASVNVETNVTTPLQSTSLLSTATQNISTTATPNNNSSQTVTLAQTTSNSYSSVTSIRNATLSLTTLTQSSITPPQSSTTPPQSSATPTQSSTTPIHSSATPIHSSITPTQLSTTPTQPITSNKTVSISTLSTPSTPTTTSSTNDTTTPKQTQTVTTYPKQDEVSGTEHFYYLTLPHVASDLIDNPNTTLTTYLTLATTEGKKVSTNITVQYPVYQNVHLSVQPGIGVTVELSPLLVPVMPSSSARGIKIQSSGCLHVILYCILEDSQLGVVMSAASTYIHPHFSLSYDYLVVIMTSYPTSAVTELIINGVRVTNPDVLGFSLNQSDVFLLESQSDLTGSRVTATSPVAVFVGMRQVSGSIAFEQLTPVAEETIQFMTWPPLSSLTSVYRMATVDAVTSLQINSSRWCDLPEPGDTCEAQVRGASQVTADKPITGLHAIFKNESNAECLQPLASNGAWRYLYTWVIPQTFVNTSSLLIDLFLIVVIKDNLKTQISLDDKPFIPDWESDLEHNGNYRFLTKRLNPGHHSLRSNESNYFGAYLLGNIQSATFCTTLGVDHLSQHFRSVCEFPLNGNKLYHSTPGNASSPSPSAYTTVSSTETSSLPTGTSTSTSSHWYNNNLTLEQVDDVLGDIREALYLTTRGCPPTAAS